MILTTKNGKTYDTQRDLSAPERHILQKLFIWESMAASIEEFREKTREAIRRGWGDSGPVRESGALHAIIADMEDKVMTRLMKEIEP